MDDAAIRKLRYMIDSMSEQEAKDQLFNCKLTTIHALEKEVMMLKLESAQSKFIQAIGEDMYEIDKRAR